MSAAPLANHPFLRLALEMASIVLAVLLALLADEWREDAQNAEIADRALAAVRAELAGNRNELRSDLELNRELLAELEGAVETLEAAPAPPEPVDPDTRLGLNFSLLVDAAWTSATLTRATHYMDFERVSAFAHTYEVQRLYLRQQERFVDSMLGSLDGMTDPAALRRLALELRSLVEIGDALVREYGTGLGETPEAQADGTPSPA
jgi:hypothetical protein